MKNLFLKARIIERFGTQTDFAKILGLSEDRLSKYIHGRLLPKEEERQLIAKKLECPESEVFPS